ncbi:MAG: TRAP transporter small permease [Burkholderiales bacterium]|nr:TRAP transporter small permease [Burkholderiales bacterium]
MRRATEPGARPVERLARWSAALACVALAAMMLVTVADVALRSLAGRPIPGTFELVELALAAAFFLALPLVFLRDANIVVDAVDHRAPRFVPALRRLGGIASAVVLALLAWQAALGARDALSFGDVSAALGLPQGLYWAPVVAGLAGALLAALVRLRAGGDA